MDNYGTGNMNMQGNQGNGNWNQMPQNYNNFSNASFNQNMNAPGPRFNPPNSMVNRTMITPIQGRVVNNVEEVRPEEVPMSGDWVFFPVSNGRDIYAMSWNLKNGIVSNHYILDTESSSNSDGGNSTEVMLGQIMERLDSLESEIKQFTAHRKKQPYMNQQKPEKKEENTNA